MSPEKIFRQKLHQELEEQSNRVSQSIGAEIIPPSRSEDIFLLSVDELKEQYHDRYEMYLDILRREKNGRHSLSSDEILSMKKWLLALNALDQYIERHKSKNDHEKTLRKHQVAVFELLRTFLEGGGKEGYIKLPTGYGKTVLFVEFIKATGLKSLIVVPGTLLIKQTKEKIEEFGGEDIDVGTIYSEAKRHGKDVTIITYQSLVSKLESGDIDPSSYDCLILDEAHRSLSKKRMDAVDQFKDMLKIGFTATPQFNEEKKVSDILEHEICSISIPEAVEQGAISPFSVILARTIDVDLSNVRITAGEYNEKELAQAVNIESRNIPAVKLYKELFSDCQGVVYCVGIEHAKDLAKMFNKVGISAAAISGEMPSDEQEELKKKLKSGEIKLLCNADILIEGFDVVQTSVCLNLRPTLSRVMAEQRGGRVLRIDKDNPAKHAFIVDFIDQSDGELVPQVLFSDIVDGAVFLRGQDSGGVGSKGAHHPDIRSIKIEGLEVITDVEEILRITQEFREMDSKNVVEVPEGWLNYREFTQLFEGESPASIKRAIDAYLTNGKNDEFVKKFGMRTYYRIELKEMIAEIMLANSIPSDWLVADSFVQEGHEGYKSIVIVRKAIDDLVANEPEYENDRKKGHYANWRYSPRLIDRLREIVVARGASKNETRNSPRPRWENVAMLLDRGYGYWTRGMIDKSIASLILKHPELEKTEIEMCYKKGAIRPNYFYSPTFIKILEEQYIGLREEPQEGWIDEDQLISGTLLTNRSNAMTIRATINRLKESNKESVVNGFKKYLIVDRKKGGGGIKEFYSFDFIRELDQALLNYM